MPICGPTNTIPSYTATPTVSFGSETCGFGGTLGIRGSVSLGYGRGYRGTISATSLGVLPGVPVDSITQIPPQKAVIQPPSCVVILPGAIMSASTRGAEIGGYSPSAVPSYGRGFGYGAFGYGGLGSGHLGSRGFSYRRGSFLGRH